MKRILIVLILSITCIVQVIGQDAQSFERLAYAGDAKAQYNLAICYFVGRGVKKDTRKAISWLKKSAEKNFAMAQYDLAMCYEKGRGVKQNLFTARDYYLTAAENGNVYAQLKMGDWYRRGYTVDEDLGQAVTWYSRAEQQGSKEARNILNSSELRNIYVSTKEPPSLEIVANSLKFNDDSGRNAIGANGNYSISFDLKNTGIGDGYNCKVNVVTTGMAEDIHYQEQTIPVIKKDETRNIVVPITSGMNTKDGNVTFAIKVVEPAGFGTDDQYVSINTRSFEEPRIQLMDYTLTSTSGGNKIKKKQPFDLQVLLQNTNIGMGEDVKVDISIPHNVVLVEGTNHSSIGGLESGQTKSMVYSLIVNNDYTASTIPITFHLSEKYGKYAEDKTINLSFDQSFASSKLAVNETLQNRKEIQLASLTSDVDKDIPKNNTKSEQTFIVIIANENYNNVTDVPFAINDGIIFKEYCTQTLGIPETNVHIVNNATLNELNRQIGWIQNVLNVHNGDANAIFYYAGHGVPDEVTKSAFLLPVDGYGNDASSGYSIDKLYSNLGKVSAKSVLVLLDACFSGAKRDGGMLASARGVAIKAKMDTPRGNMIVLSAAQADETAYPYEAQHHGMFTYYILKKMQDTKGNVSFGELSDYVIDQVRKQSVITNGKLQTPNVSVSASMNDSWRNWKLR